MITAGYSAVVDSSDPRIRVLLSFALTYTDDWDRSWRRCGAVFRMRDLAKRWGRIEIDYENSTIQTPACRIYRTPTVVLNCPIPKD